MGHLKIKSCYNALVSMIERGFFECSGEEEGTKIFRRMDKERGTMQKIKRKQEI